jgi:hypothetical protein
MSFDPIAAKTPVKPKQLRLILTVIEAEGPTPGPRTYQGAYQFEIRTASGEPLESRQGDAIPHYTAQERAQFAVLLDKGLNKAQTVVP